MIDAPVGVEKINEKKYPRTEETTPIMTERMKILLSFSVSCSEQRAGRVSRPKTGSAPMALVDIEITAPMLTKSSAFASFTGNLNNVAESGSKETNIKSL